MLLELVGGESEPSQPPSAASRLSLFSVSQIRYYACPRVYADLRCRQAEARLRRLCWRPCMDYGLGPGPHRQIRYEASLFADVQENLALLGPYPDILCFREFFRSRRSSRGPCSAQHCKALCGSQRFADMERRSLGPRVKSLSVTVLSLASGRRLCYTFFVSHGDARHASPRLCFCIAHTCGAVASLSFAPESDTPERIGVLACAFTDGYSPFPSAQELVC
jgi:hypothetical protein